MIRSDERKEKKKIYSQEYSTQEDYHLELEERDFLRQTKVKGVHHHKIDLTRNVKGLLYMEKHHI